jgi:threonine aldolase
MRQAGVIAAAGLYALEHHIDRMADDHRRIRGMAELLASVEGLEVDLGKVQTNMVYVGTRGTGRRATEIVPLLAAEGLWALDEGVWTLRFVAHLGLDEADVEEAAGIVERTVARLR